MESKGKNKDKKGNGKGNSLGKWEAELDDEEEGSLGTVLEQKAKPKRVKK
jgi:hypothetical protein